MSIEDIWDEKPDIEQMIIDVKWLSNAVINRTPCQNQFRGLLIELSRVPAWLEDVQAHQKDLEQTIINLKYLNGPLKEKAEKFDRYNLHLLSLEDVGVWGAINKLDAKLEAINLSILTARQKLYDVLPTGEVHAFELIKAIQGHIEELDEILEG